MKNKKNIFIILFLVVLSIVLILIFKNDEEEIVNIDGLINDTKLDMDNGDEDINWSKYLIKEITLSDILTIKEEGIYKLTGNISDGNIIVNTSGNVKLILNNVSISNKSGPAILIESAENTVIELENGTINTISCGSEYTNTEYDGCVFSKDDLIFQGNGKLIVDNNYLDGIVSKDDLKFISGEYEIKSQDDGIRGTDSVYIIDGDFIINSEADGIKSTNTTDSNKGNIKIENGNFQINSLEDGIQTENKIVIIDGNFKMVTGNGSTDGGSAIDKSFMGGNYYDDTSSKGIKAGDNLLIEGGNFEINSKDDTLHSNNYLGIKNGNLKLSSGDDGIHADEMIIIENGVIEINQSYEGIEANDITINGGNISVVAMDDGINVSGGVDNSAGGGRPGQNRMMSGGTGELIISGGKILVNSTGDGIDSNGCVTMDDGEVIVYGPTDGGNGVFDYDNKFDINGGTLIGIGSSGMAQGLSETSKQYSVMFYLNNTYSGGNITLIDSNENKIVDIETEKKYQLVIVSSPLLNNENEYTLKIDDKEIDTIMVNSITNSNGKYSEMMGENSGGGRMPGRK